MNIVVDEFATPKIVDFGFARHGVDKNFDNGCGTPNYMSPELLGTSVSKKAWQSDVWALGVILYYMLTKQYPYRGSVF
jgi:serine/threonine protein kinase